MAARKRHSFLTLFLIFVLCINMLNVQTVRADGETPTEPPVPTQVETEPPTEEPTEVPTEIQTGVPAQETPTPVNSVPTAESTQTPVDAEETSTPIAEILTQAPEGTEVVVIDENGESVPLASEQAAEAVIGFDPMWCPAGVLPGGAGCTTNFASIGALITDIINNTGTYTQNGVIYFIETTGVQTTGASFELTNSSLGGGDFNSISGFNLTLQGGWNGQNGGSATFGGTTNFGSSSLSVGSSGNPWAGSVSINNMSFNGVSSSNAVTVYTTSGNIALSNVDVAQQSGGNFAALLNSTSGNITIENGSSFDGNNTGGNQSEGVSATTASGSITISNTTFAESIENGTGNTNNGATLSASTVTLTNVTATGNDGNGIEVNNASLVTLNNVTASNNGTESGAPGIGGNIGSGVFVNGTAGSSVIVNGGIFNNNQEYGIELGSTANTTIYVQATPTCTGNVGSCYNEAPVVDSTPPSIVPTISGTAGANGWYTGNVKVTWAVTDTGSGIKTQSGCTTSNLTSETTGVTLTCSATNNALLSNSVSVTIKIDKTAPSAALSIISGNVGSNNWYTSNVTVQTTGVDAISGVSCTGNQVFSTDTTGQTVNGSCTNGAGLVTNAAPISFKLDKTAPVVSLSVTGGTSGANGWYTSNVTVRTTGTESTSTPITCSADQFQTSETNGTTFNGSCTNQAGLTGNATALTIKLDKTNPSISFAGRTAPNANGWNNTNVTANWTCSDAFSGPVSETVSQTLTTEGAGQSVTGTCLDLAGNSASNTQGGINIDKTDPLLSLPPGITVEATSSAGAIVTYSASVTDNLDPNVTVSCAPASGTNFAMGLTPVTCSSTDQADNTATGGFNVEVGDSMGPVIAAHADVNAEATSSAGALVNYTNPTATDAVEGPVAVTCAPASGETFPLGNTTVTCNASDSLGNAAVPETFTVHVGDSTVPVIAFHADMTVEATSPGGVTVTYTNPSATDLVDGSVPVSCAPASASTFPLGNTTVTCNATDSSGNEAAPTTFVIHVVDTTAPVILNHADVTAEATSASGAAVSYLSPDVVDAVDSGVEASCSPASGATFPLGSTTVTCNATDSSGNQAQAITFAVHVVDTTAPVIASHADLTVQATSPAGALVNYTSPSATDAVDGTKPASCLPLSGSQFAIGDHTITCNATDSHGNAAAPTTFLIHVVDTTGPVIAAHAAVTAQATSASGAQVNYTLPTATDLVDGPVPVNCVPAPQSQFPLGDTTVTCTAVDSRNNTSTSTFVVHVVDTAGPVIAAHAAVTAEATSANGAMVNYTLPTATDLVDGPVDVSCVPAPQTQFPLGDTTVTCTAIDSHENTSTSSFAVHVVDTTGPVIAAHGDVTAEATSASGAVVTYNNPSATDAVDSPITVTCAPASGTTFPLGNTTVTCNAMDTHKNTAQPVTFVVHVIDSASPTLHLPATINVNATGPGGAVVNFTVTASDSVDQNVGVSCNQQSGATFPVGSTLVTCTATDDSNNQTEGSFFINVFDPQGPILSLPGNMNVEATGPSGANVSFTVTATDLVDGNVPVECTPASGSTFAFGTTTVTCVAWDSSEHSNEGSFLVTVQDTIAPAIAPHADIEVEVNTAASTIVTYTSPSTTDAVDGPGVASCTPASGSLFPMGTTTVTCTATDEHGNTSTSTFTVHIGLSDTGTPETPGETPGNPGAIIPLTGGELIDLDCNSVLWAFGIKLSFFNLCDYQTSLNSVGAGDLPADLPEGFSFVMGLHVNILSSGQFIDELPEGTGIEMDFPIYEQDPEQFAVLFWSEAEGKWVEVTQQINADEISQTLNATADDELYQVLDASLSQLFHQALTAEQTGIFILVKK